MLTEHRAPSTRVKRLDGMTFGNWKVVEFSHLDQEYCSYWMCECVCGEKKPVSGRNLKKGRSTSCAPCSKTRHGHRTADATRPEYRAWRGAKYRCTNPKSKKWRDYGGRGITVCAEWLNDYPAFFKHVGPRPSKRHQLDRRNNDKGYEPGNVRWATPKQNCNNRRLPTKAARP